MSNPINLEIICDQCGKKNIKTTNYIDGFDKPMLKSFWCDFCGEPQVLEIIFFEGVVTIQKRLEPSEVYVPKKPETGITIKPRKR